MLGAAWRPRAAAAAERKPRRVDLAPQSPMMLLWPIWRLHCEAGHMHGERIHLLTPQRDLGASLGDVLR